MTTNLDRFLDDVVEQLDKGNAAQRADAARSLGYLGRKAVFALTDVALAARKDPAAEVRREALRSAGLIAWQTGNGRGAAMLLDQALDDAAWCVRATAAAGLIRLGIHAAPARLRLSSLHVDDPHVLVRRNAREALALLTLCEDFHTWLPDLDATAREAEARVLNALLGPNVVAAIDSFVAGEWSEPVLKASAAVAAPRRKGGRR